MIRNLIMDCDGVLYPVRELPLVEMVSAMKAVYREDMHLDKDVQAEASHKTIREQHLGIFNYIKEACNLSGYDFNLFCRQMANRIDYRKIKFNPRLEGLLTSIAQYRNVIIWSNNSSEHINKVFQRVFKQDIDAMQKKNIKVADITANEKDGYFLPKQSEEGFGIFLQNHGLIGKESILFDDTPVNLQSAARFGIKGELISEDRDLYHVLQPYYFFARNKGKSYE